LGQPIGPIFNGQESKKTRKILKSSARDENKFQGGGTCQLTCRVCGKKYMELYKEHLHPFRSNNTNSKFALHLLENDHAFGKMDDILEIMYFTEKVYGYHRKVVYI
jgi:hypothetical protein